jgi:serine/threonine protein kinase
MSTYEQVTGRLPPKSLLKQRYLIDSVAGRGGMSAVYKGIDTVNGNRLVAIKEMSQNPVLMSQINEATARFYQEADLLRSLHHPNLPRIYDAFSENGRSYLVMDYIEGKTLLQLLHDAHQPLPVPQVIDYALQLCDVLNYLHQHQPPIIFRDLKPTNVMVQRDGHIYLIDFGIARFFKEGQAQDTVFLGSPGYAPPEQHGAAQTNPRSDIYALGATLHCCLSGRDPFHAVDRFAFPPLRQINPQVPLELEQLIHQMLSMNEQQRPPSALAVQQRLLQIKHQASDATTGLAHVAAASAPTQYAQPSPVTPLRSSRPPDYAPTVQVSTNTPATSAYNTIPTVSPAASPQKAGKGRSEVWSPKFIGLFALLLAITIIGSVITFNITNPYGSGNPWGLDHATELGLSILLIIVAFASSTFVRNITGLGILFLSILATIPAGFAFFVQTVRDVQNTLGTPFLSGVSVNPLLTFGLAGAAIISLAWLLRKTTLIDRVTLLVIFGVAALCALLQSANLDGDVTKHLLLLASLILLIQGTVLAARTAQVYR